MTEEALPFLRPPAPKGAGGAPSARGLFRATGKAPKEERPRETHDFYPTPPEPIRALLAAERPALAGRVIWEPCSGDGRMAAEIAAAGWSVVESDLVDRGAAGAIVRDFFAFAAPPPGVTAIVTNPPYCEVNARDGKGRFLVHALGELGLPYVALLLNWNWFCAAGLAPVLRRWQPARVYAVRWKVDFTGQGAPPMNSGWVVWDAEHRGETVLRTLDRLDARQGALFEGEG